jgi:hypothetical protein
MDTALSFEPSDFTGVNNVLSLDNFMIQIQDLF